MRSIFQVILRAPYIGPDHLTRARYQQMIGRAGRAGFDTHGESILIAQPYEMPFVTKEILLAPIDNVQSQLAQDGHVGLQQLILSLISLDLGGKEHQTLCETLRRSTLFGLQVIIKTLSLFYALQLIVYCVPEFK